MQVTDSDRQALAEAMRRRSGQLPSSVGIAGGAPVANTISPANPIAQAGETPQQSSGQPGAGGYPSGSGVKQLKSAQGESTFIVKALSDRLKALTSSGQ